MKTHLYCIPCLTRQMFDAACMATDDETLREEIVRRALRQISDAPLSFSPPQIAALLHRTVREVSGHTDPYLHLKDAFNKKALDLLPELEARVAQADDPLDAAVRIAIAGNIIDFGVAGHDAGVSLHETIDRCLAQPYGVDDLAFLRETASAAQSILYLADNTGEIVFDIPLLKQLGSERVTYVVRGAPTLNDATLDDARACGIDKLVTVIDNGTDIPGTVLPECTEELRTRFAAADLVLAKGQGNFESLDTADHPALVFLFQVKCKMVAEQIGCPLLSLVACAAVSHEACGACESGD